MFSVPAEKNVIPNCQESVVLRSYPSSKSLKPMWDQSYSVYTREAQFMATIPGMEIRSMTIKTVTHFHSIVSSSAYRCRSHYHFKLVKIPFQMLFGRI